MWSLKLAARPPTRGFRSGQGNPTPCSGAEAVVPMFLTWRIGTTHQPRKDAMDLDLLGGLEALKECAKPLVISLPDSEQQVLVTRALGTDGLIETSVDVRTGGRAVWIPIELCGGSFEVREA